MTEFSQDREKDFFKRTMINLKRYNDAHQEDPKDYPFGVTMLLNSLFGTLIVPQENLDILKAVDIAFLRSKYNGSSKDFFRHMRNSLSHGHFIKGISIDPDTKEIVSVNFQDTGKKNNKKNTFDITLSVEELKQLIVNINNVFTDN